MNFEDISNLSFSNKEELKQYLQKLAFENGFKIFVRDSCSDRIRFYCSERQTHKNVVQSVKSDCPFHLNFNRDSNGLYKLSPNSNFLHTHPLKIKEITTHQIPDEICNIIKSMKEIGISNFHIITYVEKKFNLMITVKEISKIMSIHSYQDDLSETDEMNEYMKDKGNLYLFQNFDGISGFLTQTFEEQENLLRYGDFIVIDGTTIPNFLNWTIVPISLQGNYGELLSGGVAFTSSECKDYYHWLICQIKIINPLLKAVISDEDSSICPVMDEFSDLVHILCAKHKISNLIKKIPSKHPKVKLFIELINKIFYSRFEKTAVSAKNKLYEEFPEIVSYFDEHVLPFAHKLFSSVKPDVFIFNHTFSQLAESYNNMIKRDLGNNVKHLFEIREHISKKFAVKNSLEARIRETSFRFHHFLLDIYQLNISKNICKMVDNELSYINKIEIFDCDDNTWLAKEEEEYFYLNFKNCQCHFPIQSGVPCRHLMALYQSKNLDFPVHLINKRFSIVQHDLKNNFQLEWNEDNEEEDDDSDYIHTHTQYPLHYVSGYNFKKLYICKITLSQG